MPSESKTTPLDLCHRANETLKRCGFDLVYVSQRSEACYFAYPGREGVIRVAQHRGGKAFKKEDSINGKVILSKITFSPKHPNPTELTFTHLMSFGIGRYFLNQEKAVSIFPISVGIGCQVISPVSMQACAC